MGQMDFRRYVPAPGPTPWGWLIMILLVAGSCFVCLAFFKSCYLEMKKVGDNLSVQGFNDGR